MAASLCCLSVFFICAWFMLHKSHALRPIPPSPRCPPSRRGTHGQCPRMRPAVGSVIPKRGANPYHTCHGVDARWLTTRASSCTKPCKSTIEASSYHGWRSSTIRIETLSREPQSSMALRLRASAARWTSPCRAISARIRSQASWFVSTSKRPSHARSKKSSAGMSVTACTSGSAIINGFDKSVSGLLSARPPLPAVGASSPKISLMPFLNSASPNARDTASSPMTRLWMMNPPAALIRAASSSRDGLWSSESGTASPLRQSTVRESPTFPQ
mmetsp:Transcript_2336/g.5225  ORF Transcript_2336/g.5225 Transcript_2336/m.5225 type:complete len:272 (-) Transcript_2336:1024-1839(-)